MYKVQVNVPAALHHLGPGLNTLGLALSLHVHIEMTTRSDGELTITLLGEGKDSLPTNFRNPVLKAAARLFQLREAAPAGLNIVIENRIPLGVGLDAEAALLIGGLVAANNVIDGGFDQHDIINLAQEIGISHISALTAVLGGLNICLDDGERFHKSLEPPPLKIVLVAPRLPDYAALTQNLMPQTVSLRDAAFNIGRSIFLIDALMAGDFDMLSSAIQDHLYQEAFIAQIPGYAQAVEAAKASGAAAVTLASTGPGVIAFAPYNHALIADAMSQAFQQAGVSECRTWTLGIDGQGVTVSVVS